MATPMKILVIGKRGQLGQALCALGSPFGHEVIGTTSTECDITNPEQTRTVIERHAPELIINTAAYNLLPKAEVDPAPAFALNAVAVHHLARLCTERGIRCITYSTDYVFDGMSSVPYCEEDTPHPLQMYGISKLAGELACVNADARHIVIRTCGVYGGMTGSPVKGNFVLYILKEAQTKKELSVGAVQRSIPTYSVDLAQATYQLLQENPAGGLYHLVNEGNCSWAEFAQEIVGAAALPLRIIPQDAPLTFHAFEMKRPLFSVLRNTKARALGITLRPWQEALRAYVDFLKNS